MILNELKNKEKFYRIIVNELKDCGIKFRRDKNVKNWRDEKVNKIFATPLDLLELTDAHINGGVVPIPKFVYDACNYVTANITMEGLFRKAGSNSRQKDIKAGLEMGLKLGKQHHAIDVANILKSFFRDLPQPMIPPGNIQDSMLKCLISTEKKVDNLLLTCLLLPPLTLNTFAYFMQFLKKISENSASNRMTIENLSIIFAPGLMPINQMSEERLKGHVRVICLLIENASKIGIIPDYLMMKAQNIGDEHDSKQANSNKSKRKARRSGSLTRMFNGLRKIVGGGIGSNENLHSSPDSQSSAKPCINKSAKKRALETPVFSTKKKKNILAMQQQPDSLAASTPFIKKSKLRLSLDARVSHGNNRFNTANKRTTNNLNGTPRRWSFIESPRSLDTKPGFITLTSTPTPRSSLSCVNKMELDINQSFSNEITTQPINSILLHAKSYSESNIQGEPEPSIHVELDYVKIPVEEYVEIKERVTTLEKRISEEFKCLSNCGSICIEDESADSSGPERVQNKFEEILEKTVSINENSISGQLVNQLKQELRIRNKNEPRIIRSPSARKIGIIRRRSRELTISRSSNSMKQKIILCDESTNRITKSLSNPKINLKRGKPNTVTTGLTHPVPAVKDAQTGTTSNIVMIENVNCPDITPKYRQSLTNVHLKNCTKSSASPLASMIITPNKNSIASRDFEFGTPLVPASSHKKTKIISLNSKPSMRSSLLTKNFNQQQLNGTGTDATVNGVNLFPEIKEQTGRASIARIRAQNAGMVMEKAKLFNGMSSRGKM